MDMTGELERLSQLRQSGVLTDEEFALAKARILADPGSAQGGVAAVPALAAGPADPADLDRRAREWGLFLHLSVLAVLIVPLAGIVLPLVIWQIKKDELPGIDAHGKNAINWILSEIIYLFVGIVLTFVLIGIPLLVAVCVAGVAFPIIAAVKANNGEIWKYPLAFPFLS